MGTGAQMTGLGMLRDGALIAGVYKPYEKSRRKMEKVLTQCYGAA